MVKRIITLAFYALLPLLGKAQTFQDFLNRVNTAPDGQRSAIVDSFMNAVSTFPLREQDTICHFVYRGVANGVNVPGDANNWDASAFPMSRLSTTDLWYKTQVFEPDARLDYKFVLNGSNWVLDPRNPFTVNGGFGPNSELRMPGYVIPSEIRYYADIPHGLLRDTTYFSTNLNNSRTIRIYTPPGYESTTDSFGVMLFHDGIEYSTLAQANNVIDYLISQSRIRPIIGVFVPPVNRVAEYRTTLVSAFSSFIVNELMPYIDARYRTRRSPGSHAVMGASDGGNVTLWLGLYYSNVFGNVAAQSSNIVTAISSGFQNGPQVNVKLYLDLGTYDIPQLVPLVRSFIPILQSRGYTYQYREYHEGHSWGNWRAHIDNALEMFFPLAPATVNEVVDPLPAVVLEQNYPNPFNPTTTFNFQLRTGGVTRLTIYDMLGREVATIVNEHLNAGTYSIKWRTADQPSGTYFYRLHAGLHVATKKLLLIR